MASTEAKAKWLRGSRPPPPPALIGPSSSEGRSNGLHFIKLWWSYQQHKANNAAGSFWNPGGGCCDVDKLFSEWFGVKKNEAWWRKADLVLLQHFDNCHLPLSQTNKTCDKGLTSLHPAEKEKSTDVNVTQCGLDTTSFSDYSKKLDINISKGELLEALCRSQRRAREAEKAAQEACNEKEHVITLFLIQASHIFAYKQWLYILHLETLRHNSRRNSHPIHNHFHDSVPWKMNK